MFVVVVAVVAAMTLKVERVGGKGLAFGVVNGNMMVVEMQRTDEGRGDGRHDLLLV